MKVKTTRSTVLFYIAYIIWISINILKSTYFREMYTMQILFKILNISIYGILILKLILDNRYSIRTILFGIISILVLIVYRNSNARILLETILFIYSSRNVPFRDIVKVTINIQVIFMIIIVLSSLSGIIKNDKWYRSNGDVRYGLGYTYCTFIANFYYHIILMYVFLKENKKFKFCSVLLILMLNKIIYILTDTKAVYYLVLLLVIYIYILNYHKINIKKNLLCKFIFKYSFVICATISIFFSITYNSSNKIHNILNSLLTDRLALGYAMYKEYGIPLFGQMVEWTTGRPGIERPISSVYKFVDSSYLNAAMNYGIIILILVCIGFIIIGKRLIEENNINGCLALLFLAVHSISDPQLFHPQYHPFLLMFGYLFYEQGKCIRVKI